MKAIWKGTTIAESDNTIVMENNHYFPKNSINPKYLLDSTHTSVCPWKGSASYKSIKINGEINENATWYYPNPKDAAKEIKDHFAFWKGVKIIDDN